MDNWFFICLNLIVGGFLLGTLPFQYSLLKFRKSLKDLSLSLGEFSSQSDKNTTIRKENQ